VTEFFRKNNCSRDNRARQSTATSLVDPGNTSDTCGAEFLLITKSAASIHFRDLTI
jgi:hypothetical protein